MIEESDIVFLYAETAVHAGDGASTGSVDLPIQRDAQSGHPIFRYGTVKGAFRDACRQAWSIPADPGKRDRNAADVRDWEAVFGPDTDHADEFAGAAVFSDARLLLLFPVRSLRGVTAWITCPMALAYLQRDAARADKPTHDPKFTGAVEEGKALVGANCPLCVDATADAKAVVFEEFHLSAEPDTAVSGLAKWLADSALPPDAAYDFWRKRLCQEDGASHLAILSDTDFTYYVEHATNVVQRNKINHDTGTVTDGGLWTEESLPADSLLYGVIHARDTHRAPKDDAPPARDAKQNFANLRGKLTERGGLIQIGGNETVGQGVVRLRFLTPEARNAQS